MSSVEPPAQAAADSSVQRLKFPPVVAVIFGIVLAFGFLEGGMRLTGALISRPAGLDKIPQRATNEVRIVCLGESTTASVLEGGQDVSWPGYLERKLNALQSGVAFRIYNLARFGTSTPFLLRDIEKQIQQIDPQIVISMMGINDLAPIRYVQVTDGIGALRVVKLYSWILQSLRQVAMPYASEDELQRVFKKVDALARQAYTGADRPGSHREVPARFESFREGIESLASAAKPRLRPSYYLRAAVLLFDAENELRVRGAVGIETLDSMRQVALNWSRAAVELNPLDPYALRYFLYTSNPFPELYNERVVRIQNAIDRGIEFDEVLISLVSDFKEATIRNALGQVGIRNIRGSSPVGETQANYHALARLLKKRNIAYFAMQYPTARISGLRTMFSSVAIAAGSPLSFTDLIGRTDYAQEISPEFADVRFISNENFSAVVNAQNEWEYFRDFFAVRQGLRIGHTTKKGSELIAVNVVKEFRDHWTELGLPPLRRTR